MLDERTNDLDAVTDAAYALLDRQPRGGSMVLVDGCVRCPTCLRFVSESRIATHAATCATLRAAVTP